MKAKQDFKVYLDTELGIPISYKSGEPMGNIKEIKVIKGQEIPKEIERDILQYNKELIDLKIENGKPIVPKELESAIEPIPMITKRLYNRESLNTIYEKDGMKGLKDIGATFNPTITDRSKNHLITEILTAQERIRRLGA